MIDEKMEKLYKQKIRVLEDAYAEVLQCFHEIDHYSVNKNLNVACFEIDRAIKDLKAAVE